MVQELDVALWHHLFVGVLGPALIVLLGVVNAIALVTLVGSWLDRHRIVWGLLTVLPFRTLLLGGIIYCHWGLAPHLLGIAPYFLAAGWLLYALILLTGAFLMSAAVVQLHRFGNMSVLMLEIGRDLFFGVSVLSALCFSLQPGGLGMQSFIQISLGNLQAANQAVVRILLLFAVIELLTGVLQAGLQIALNSEQTASEP